MRIPRVHLEGPLVAGAVVALPDAVCEHLLRVLRLPDGASLILCNGDGSDYLAHLDGVGKRGAYARILSAEANASESPLRIVLAQAIARGEKMDWVVQKATELGVAAIVPIVSERTEVRLDAERAPRRLAHWRGVAVAACEQSGRARVPEIAEPVALANYLAGVPSDALRLTLDPGGASGASLLPSDTTSIPAIHVAVGPEGGWSERDLAALGAGGFRGMRLGPRILRTETAGIAAIAALQALRGDLR